MTTFWEDDWDAQADYDDERYYARMEAEADARQERIDAGECVCRDGEGPWDFEGGPDYWADSDCPMHGDDVED